MTRHQVERLLLFLGGHGVSVVTHWIGDEPQVKIEGCEGSLERTLAWAALEGIDQNRFLGALGELGFPCDCEVLTGGESLIRVEH